jgi:1-acyl-sn-glycerol-3-phosphate acyltransferase
MQKTVFRTPLLSPLLSSFAALLLKLIGWRVVGVRPTLSKYVLIGAPHTSNWDFPLMLMAVLKLRMDVHWLGKDSLFPKPVGGLMRWLGGIAIDRSKTNRRVEQLVALYQRSEELAIVIPPEGTRAKVAQWKSGFYHIARGAGVPIVLGYVDAAMREVGLGPLFYPSGDFERDLTEIQKFYRTKQGIRPEHA